MSEASDIQVVILAGGLGIRLQPVVKDRPKALAKVGNVPFVTKLLNQLNDSGFKDIVVCIGYLGNQIKDTFGHVYKNLNLQYSEEQQPLGTGGALRLALHLIKSENVLVLNGDSYSPVNFKEFLKFHLGKKADISMVISQVKKTDRFGRVNLSLDERITDFQEKGRGGTGWTNAGTYLIKRTLISEIPEGSSSLEKEIFPTWLERNFYGYKNEEAFIDIGTPSSYSKAEEFFRKLEKRFILLDRDGTVIEEKNYLSNPADIKIIPNAVETLKKMQEMGFGLVMITNQSGVGRGYFTLETLKSIHARLTEILKEQGVVLDDIYFCPHRPEDDCLCRKPKTGMVKEAIRKHHFDPKLSFVIGDKISDIEMGKKIGATTILVRTGYGSQTEQEIEANYVVDDLKAALSIIESN